MAEPLTRAKADRAFRSAYASVGSPERGLFSDAVEWVAYDFGNGETAAARY